MRLIAFGVGVWVAATILSSAAWADDYLKYQKRGDRSEGTRDQLVGGINVDLLSVRARYDEAIDRLGERIYLRFYLPERSPAHVTVREVDNRYYYWLDNVQPKSPWRQGFNNSFDWSTGDVIRQLGDLRLDDLGVLVRLGANVPSANERVAPAILYQIRPPAQIHAYEFTFTLREDSSITAEVLTEGASIAVFSKKIERQIGGSPFSVVWNAAQAAPGAYRLILKGYARSNNEKVSQEVHFYHQPAVQ